MAWEWIGSILDGLGRITAAGFDGTYLYTGGDTGLMHRGTIFENPDTDVPNGRFIGFNSGVAAIGSSYNEDQKHVAAIGCDINNPTVKYALVGDGTNGGILKRTLGEAKWTLKTSAYWGNATNKRDGTASSIPGSEPRQGGRRLEVFGNVVWASAYKSAGAGDRGIVRSIDAGNSWHPWRFDANREYTGLFLSPNYRTAGSAVLYATHRTGGLTVCRSADHASASAWDVTNPTGGLSGLMALCVINEEGTDVVYVVNGCDDSTTADRGVWKCKMVGNVSTNSYTPQWTKVSTGLPASSGSPGGAPTNWWTSIAGRRSPGSGGVPAGDPADVPVANKTEFSLPAGSGAGWGLGWNDSLAGDKTYGQSPPAKGRVSAIHRVGNWIYIGGQFHQLVDQTGATRNTVRHLVRVAADAVPANHGNWDSAWVPDLGNSSDTYDSGWVKHIVSVDPGDGNGVRLIVAGDFTDIAGASQKRLACYRIASGTPTLDTTAMPDLAINDIVSGIGVDGTNLYITGQFTSVAGVTRLRLAKLTFNGIRWVLDATPAEGGTNASAWKPTLDNNQFSLAGGTVIYGSRVLPVPSQDRVVVCGAFGSLNGSTSRWYLSAVNKTTGASVAWADQLSENSLTFEINMPPGQNNAQGKRYPTHTAILVVESGTPYIYSGHGGDNMAAKWNATTGALVWYWCSNGGIQACGTVNGKVVFGFHDNKINPQKNGLKDPTKDRVGIFMVSADGNTLDDWAPAVGAGNDNGGPLKVWSISQNATHLYVGGDFTTVAGTNLDRFAIFAVPTGSGGGTTTELVIGNHVPNAVTSPNAYQDWTGAWQDRVGTHYRTLNSGDSWSDISSNANVNMVVYGETEQWYIKEIPQVSTNQSILSGSQYSSTQLVYDHVNQIMLSAGKAGVWRCDNPWDATPVWQPMVSGLGGVIARSVVVDPTNSGHVFMSDVDRPIFRWLQGGDDQAHNNYMDELNGSDPIQTLCYQASTGVLWVGQKANSATVYKNTDPWGAGTFSAAGIAAPGASTTDEAISIFAWHNGTANRLLIMTVGNKVRYSSNGGSSWTTSTFDSNYTSTNASDAAGHPRFVAKAGSPKVWMFNPHSSKANGGGLWYSDNSGQSWHRVWAKVLGATARIYGFIAQDTTTENRLYVTFDDGGLWIVTNADTKTQALNDDGTTPGGASIAATKKLASRKCGALTVDPTNGDVVVCVPVTDSGNVPDILLSTDTGFNFTSIADQNYPDLGYGPQDVAKVNDRIYVALDGASMFRGSLVGTAGLNRPLFGTTNGVSSATASLTAHHSLSGTTGGTSSASGQLRLPSDPEGVNHVLSGTTTGTSTASLNAGASSVSLVGTTNGMSNAFGNLSVNGVEDPTPPADSCGGYGSFGYAGAWYGGPSIYAGYASCFDDAIPSPSITSNLLNPNDSQGRLGCGVPSFFLTSRCSGTVSCVLDGLVSDAIWDRRLDEVSQAEIEVQLGGDTTFTCCACLAETEPWCHELHIWRDGEEVWVGPVQELEYSYDKVVIRASDSLAWLGVRIPAVNVDFTNPGFPGESDLTDIAEALLTVAFAEDAPEYTCELDNMYTVPTGYVQERYFAAYDQTALEILRDLAETGLDFTTLGRTIVLVGDSASLTPLVLLNDEHIVGDITVTKDGNILGNRYYVHFEDDAGLPAMGQAADFYCYGLIERIRDGDGLVNQADAQAVANAYASAAAIASRSIEIPPGSKLSPHTPWTINQMVPGARVDVAVTRLCLKLTQSFRLTGVEVSYSEADGESVGVTLVPMNSVDVV